MASDARRILLDRVVDHLIESGVNDISLRSLAAGIDTSHRMLLYHFGSFEGLLQAVVGEVEERQRTYLQQLASSPDLTLPEVAMALWNRLSAKKMQPLERLFFSLYARLLEQDDAAGAARLVHGWLETVTALLVERGVAVGEARTLARLGLAVSRGLLLDLLATGDRRGANAAMRAYVDVQFGS